MLRHLVLSVFAASVVGLAAPASQAGQLFDELSKDFGSVPRGTILSHQFTCTNTTNQPLHVASLRTSCVCTTATLAKSGLQPGESAILQVSIDTHKFSGSRVFTVIVLLDQPTVQEVRILLTATSREDITVEPGQLAFGRVKKGTAATATAIIEYHGTADWQITAVENDNGYLHAEVQRIKSRTAPIVYQLEAKLREDTPVGAWHGDIWLKTNDVSTPKIRVPMVVEIESLLTATPSEVSLGTVERGSKSEKRVVIRGPAPFKVVKINGTGGELEVTGGNDKAKEVQVLKVTFTAGKGSVEFHKHLQVVTDLPADETVDFRIHALVGP
jgi:hypothetical protein